MTAPLLFFRFAFTATYIGTEEQTTTSTRDGGALWRSTVVSKPERLLGLYTDYTAELAEHNSS